MRPLENRGYCFLALAGCIPKWMQEWHYSAKWHSVVTDPLGYVPFSQSRFI